MGVSEWYLYEGLCPRMFGVFEPGRPVLLSLSAREATTNIRFIIP